MAMTAAVREEHKEPGLKFCKNPQGAIRQRHIFGSPRHDQVCPYFKRVRQGHPTQITFNEGDIDNKIIT